jgi:hypothetical protein
MRQPRFSILLITTLFCASHLPAQDADRAITTPAQPPAQEDKRLFGIIPNYRTIPTTAAYEPLTAHQKFKLATQDALDRGTFILAAVYAGEGQLTKAQPSFGQGAEGYAHYFATSYVDWAGADYMTEAIFPALLHQDPRYFRKGTGSGFSRLTYAMSRIFWTRTDSGGYAFNFSEVGGNAAMVALSQAYYPDTRRPGSAAGSLAIQIGDDMASNILKEFYPDLARVFSRKHHPKTQPQP